MALPSNINHQDRLLTVNLNEEKPVLDPLMGTSVQPLFLDTENGVWVLYVHFPPGTLLPKHYHTGSVHFLTVKGEWNYVEYPDDKQTAGSYLYEPAGSIHQFSVPADAKEAAEGFMVVYGANVNFDENGDFVDVMDASSIELSIQQACEALGQKMPNYIRPGAGADFVNSE